MKHPFAIYPNSDGCSEHCNIFYTQFVWADDEEDALRVAVERTRDVYSEKNIWFDEADYIKNVGVQFISFMNRQGD